MVGAEYKLLSDQITYCINQIFLFLRGERCVPSVCDTAVRTTPCGENIGFRKLQIAN